MILALSKQGYPCFLNKLREKRLFMETIDVNILNYLNTLHNGVLDQIMIGFTTLGNKGLIWIILTLILIITKKYRKEGLIIALALILDFVISVLILKNVFNRPRPFITYGVDLLINAPHGSSFPSGHTSSSTIATLLIVLFQIKYKKIKLYYGAIILALGIILSRLYLFVHYPSDVIAGMVLALFEGFIIYCLFTRKRGSKEYEVKKNIC